ncbi:MAG: hypothetical protein E7671_00675 [Ruminococcaceae bacterium]|nr:hypothetical protein [Oscillospiraceae bacterium]
MHFKTIERDEVLPMLEQTKNVKEQKEILCDLLDCNMKELNSLIRELRAEREEAEIKPAPEASKKSPTISEEIEADTAEYAKRLEVALFDTQTRADKAEAELKDLKELLAWQTHRTHEQGEKCEALSDALAKALALIASLNRVINIDKQKA